MNAFLRIEARRLLAVEPEDAGVARKACSRHGHRPIEDRPFDCRACAEEFAAILHAGADANRSLVKWKNDAMKLLREAFGITEAKQP